jgi:hypothetical protein
VTYGSSNQFALFKMPGIDLMPNNVTGAKICITLRTSGVAVCPSVNQLCTGTNGVW